MQIRSPFIRTLAVHCELQSVLEANAAQRPGEVGRAYVAHNKFLQGLLGVPPQAADLYCLSRLGALHSRGLPQPAQFLAEARADLASMAVVCS